MIYNRAIGQQNKPSVEGEESHCDKDSSESPRSEESVCVTSEVQPLPEYKQGILKMEVCQKESPVDIMQRYCMHNYVDYIVYNQ